MSHETVRRALEKRTQAVEKSRLANCLAGEHCFHGGHGKSAGHLQPPLRCKAPPVVCMDETPRQLIRENRELIAAAPGQPQRHDYEYEYERCGVCNVFMASEPLAGRRTSKVTERRTKLD